MIDIQGIEEYMQAYNYYLTAFAKTRVEVKELKHYDTILNYFKTSSTNAAAESFNAKIKEFRRQFRGVKDVKFFLLRHIYAANAVGWGSR